MNSTSSGVFNLSGTALATSLASLMANTVTPLHGTIYPAASVIIENTVYVEALPAGTKALRQKSLRSRGLPERRA